jgi:hypothetical protein
MMAMMKWLYTVYAMVMMMMYRYMQFRWDCVCRSVAVVVYQGAVVIGVGCHW